MGKLIQNFSLIIMRGEKELFLIGFFFLFIFVLAFFVAEMASTIFSERKWFETYNVSFWTHVFFQAPICLRFFLFFFLFLGMWVGGNTVLERNAIRASCAAKTFNWPITTLFFNKISLARLLQMNTVFIYQTLLWLQQPKHFE